MTSKERIEILEKKIIDLEVKLISYIAFHAHNHEEIHRGEQFFKELILSRNSKRNNNALNYAIRENFIQK